MTRHDATVAVGQMRDHASEAVAIAANRSRTDLDVDRVFSLALTKLVEIVGEAAFRVPPSIRDAHPEVPWNEIIATRNRLVHGYDQVDFDILWRIVTDDLPPLVRQLETILSGLPQSGW